MNNTQSLFHNLLVQDSVLNLLPSKKQEAVDTRVANRSGPSSNGSDAGMVPVIESLQCAFAHMRLSHHGTVDLSPFVGE